MTPDEIREKRIAQHQRWCRHFTGLQHDTCKAGFTYATLKDESVRPFRWPCLDHDAATTCPERSTLSREEAIAEVDDSTASIARVGVCLKAIREKHGKTRGLVDAMPCPTGCGGTLRYSIAAYNGHVHGTCSTEDCASWMQ